jgi:hypothetical protein
MDTKNTGPIKNLDEFVAKIDEMKKKDKMDLSSDQDLTIAIMNLVGIEEHFFFTAEKTGKKEYYDFLYEVREMRKELLKKVVGEPEGEVWCISKHLLAASYRLMEVGTKQLTLNNKEEAYDLFAKSFKCYTLFWGLNMGVLKSDDIKKIDDSAVNKHDSDPDSKSFMGKLGDFVKKAINCCKE